MSFIILEKKQVCSLPAADLQVSLNKTVNAICSEVIQICQGYLSTLCFALMTQKLAWELRELKLVFLN